MILYYLLETRADTPPAIPWALTIMDKDVEDLLEELLKRTAAMERTLREVRRAANNRDFTEGD